MQIQNKRIQFRNNTFLFFIMVLGLLAACNPYGATPVPNPEPVTEFVLKPISDKLELATSGETSTIINLERQEGFADTVNMTFEGLPEGVEQVWSRDTENGDCTVRLIAHSEVAEGTYTATLRGIAQSTNNTLSALGEEGTSQPVAITITLPKPFSASLQPAILPMPVNSLTTLRLLFNRKASFDQVLLVRLLNVPAGVTTGACTDESGCQSAISGSEFNFNVRVAADAPQGQKTLTAEISSFDGRFKQTVPLQINIEAPFANPDFRLLTPSLNVSAPFNTPVPIRLTVIRIKGFDKGILVKTNTPGFSSTEITLRGNENAAILNDVIVPAAPPPPQGARPAENLGTLNVAKLSDVTLALPATQTLEILAQGVTTNLSKNADVNFSVLPVAGDQDFSFKSSLEQVGSADHGLVVLPDGKVVVGSTENGTFILKRFNTDGSSDPGFVSRFQSNGVKISFQGVASLQALALAPDGDIVAVGTVTQNNDVATSKIAVVKVNPDGSLDTTFGDGKIINLFSSEGRDVTVTSSGQILIAGQSAGDALSSNTLQAQATVLMHCVVVALEPNGSLDSSFSGDGISAFRADSSGFGQTSDGCNAVALAPNNLIAVGGVSRDDDDSRFFVARLQANGNPDANFGGGDGMVVTDLNELTDAVNNLVVQPNGKIIAAGLGVDNNTEFGILARYNTTGGLDSTFDSDGIRATQTHTVRSGQFFERGILGLALEANGNILLADDQGSTSVLRRLKADGSTFELNLNVGTVTDLQIAANGKIMLLGTKPQRRFP